MRYKIKQKYRWTNDIAYLAGLIASDGCLSRDGRHISLVSTDISLLKSACLILDRLETDIKPHNTGSTHPGRLDAFRLQWSEVSLYDFFLKSGITPTKSTSINSVNVPNEYFADFLRGMFDGDGSVYGSWDTRWRSSFSFYLQFTSASVEFLDHIKYRIEKIFETAGGSISKSSRAFCLRYGKQDSHKLFNIMYANAGTHYLERKREAIEGFIKQDINATIDRNARVQKLVDWHA